MSFDRNCVISGGEILPEDFRVRPASPMLYDCLRTLSAEYSVSVETLINIAVKRLVNDIIIIPDYCTQENCR